MSPSMRYDVSGFRELQPPVVRRHPPPKPVKDCPRPTSRSQGGSPQTLTSPLTEEGPSRLHGAGGGSSFPRRSPPGHAGEPEYFGFFESVTRARGGRFSEFSDTITR